MASGRVEIGCFRTYPDSYVKELEAKGQGGSKLAVPEDKMEEFGLHALKYYRLEHSFFKSNLDNQILQTLWNEYWIQTLSASPLIANKAFLSEQICDIAKKIS